MPVDEPNVVDRVFNIEHVNHFTEYTIDKSSREFKIIADLPSDSEKINKMIIDVVGGFFAINRQKQTKKKRRSSNAF